MVLKESGYVLYDAQTHSYRLGYRFLYMGSVLLHQVEFRSETRVLKKLVSLTEETAELSTRVKDEIILIDQAESPQAVRLFSIIGSSYPYFHATAAGKVYLAHMTEEKLQQVIEKIGLPSITKFTLRSFGVLKKELKRIRSQGYAVDDQEMRLGVFRIASPVFDQDGKIIACLGVAGPSFRLNRHKQKSIGIVIREVAKELSGEVTRNE